MTLKDLLFEHQVEKKIASASVPSHTSPVAATVPIGFSYPANLSSLATAAAPFADSGIYEQIHAKTDFDSTQAGGILNKYLSPLSSLSLDKSIKLKMAIAQASQIDGLDAARVLATFDGLRVSLQNETEAFQTAAKEQTEHEVTSRQTRIAEITTQIQKLQTEQQQLDEPFSGLDILMEDKTLGLILKVANLDNLNTVIVVTHDVSAAASICDHLWLLGRERDGEGNFIPGARIIKNYDLIEAGLCWEQWQGMAMIRPQLSEFIRLVKSDFVNL